jgi:CRISPR-associated endonuclease Cas2
MAKPPKKEFDLKEKIERLRNSGFSEKTELLSSKKTELDSLKTLPERIELILGIIKKEPLKAIEMNYLILYDIEKNKIRNLISKYLIQKGCIRIQKSVFLVHSNHKKFDEIKETLAEINDIYENEDSIILIPINVSDARSMKLIGKNVDINQIVNRPNTVFI